MEAEATFTLYGDHTYGFALGAYDPHYPLVIDPELSYSTFPTGDGHRIQARLLARKQSIRMCGGARNRPDENPRAMGAVHGRWNETPRPQAGASCAFS